MRYLNIRKITKKNILTKGESPKRHFQGCSTVYCEFLIQMKYVGDRGLALNVRLIEPFGNTLKRSKSGTQETNFKDVLQKDNTVVIFYKSPHIQIPILSFQSLCHGWFCHQRRFVLTAATLLTWRQNGSLLACAIWVVSLECFYAYAKMIVSPVYQSMLCCVSLFLLLLLKLIVFLVLFMLVLKRLFLLFVRLGCVMFERKKLKVKFLFLLSLCSWLRKLTIVTICSAIFPPLLVFCGTKSKWFFALFLLKCWNYCFSCLSEHAVLTFPCFTCF